MNLLSFLRKSFDYFAAPSRRQISTLTHKNNGTDIDYNCTPRFARRPVSANSVRRDKSAHSGRHSSRKAAAHLRRLSSQQPKAPRVQRGRRGAQPVADKGSLSLSRLTIHGKGV